MNNDQSQKNLKLIVTIVNRGHGEEITKLCNKEHVNVHLICFGRGTASSEILDYLGIGEIEKDIVISLAPTYKIPSLLKSFSTHMDIKKPGRGIVFTIPITGISSFITQLLPEKEVTNSESDVINVGDSKYELILAVVSRGYSDAVMDAAKGAGAGGGTVLEARGLGYEEAEKFLGVSIQAEKTVVAILCRKEDKHDIMVSINKEAGLKTEARGILMSVPVDDVIGINGLEKMN